MLHRIFCICFICLEQFRWFWQRRELSGDWGGGWYFTYTGLASLGAGLHFHPFLLYIINIFYKHNSLDLFVHQCNDLYCPRTLGIVSGVFKSYCQYSTLIVKYFESSCVPQSLIGWEGDVSLALIGQETIAMDCHHHVEAPHLASKSGAFWSRS